MNFTQDWFSPHIPSWETILIPALAGRPCHALEIGSYEGRSMAWLMAHALTHPESRLTCVDSWIFPEVEQRYDANAIETGAADRIRKCKGNSREVLRQVRGPFDFIYVDGDHSFQGVLADTVLTIGDLKIGGLIVWDDYNHPDYPGCRKAVEAILEAWDGELEVLCRGRQVIARKLAKARARPST